MGPNAITYDAMQLLRPRRIGIEGGDFDNARDEHNKTRSRRAVTILYTSTIIIVQICVRYCIVVMSVRNEQNIV